MSTLNTNYFQTLCNANAICKVDLKGSRYYLETVAFICESQKVDKTCLVCPIKTENL